MQPRQVSDGGKALVAPFRHLGHLSCAQLSGPVSRFYHSQLDSTAVCVAQALACETEWLGV